MADILQMHRYHVTKQPQPAEETEQVCRTTSSNTEIVPFMNSCTDIICGDFLRCLCCCCYLAADNSDFDCNCCCNGADCSGCNC